LYAKRCTYLIYYINLIIIEIRIPLNWSKIFERLFYFETAAGFIFIIRHRFSKRNCRFQFMSITCSHFRWNRVHYHNIYIYMYVCMCKIWHNDRIVFWKNLIKTSRFRTLFPSYFPRFNQTLIYIILYISTWLRELLKIEFIAIAALQFLFLNWSISFLLSALTTVDVSNVKIITEHITSSTTQLLRVPVSFNEKIKRLLVLFVFRRLCIKSCNDFIVS